MGSVLSKMPVNGICLLETSLGPSHDQMAFKNGFHLLYSEAKHLMMYLSWALCDMNIAMYLSEIHGTSDVIS